MLQKSTALSLSPKKTVHPTLRSELQDKKIVRFAEINITGILQAFTPHTKSSVVQSVHLLSCLKGLHDRLNFNKNLEIF